MDSMSTPITIFRDRPSMPAEAKQMAAQENCMSVRVVCRTGAVIEWYKDGVVQETLLNGDITLFPARPTYKAFLDGSYTLAEFSFGSLNLRPQLRGNYIEFRGDGATVYRQGGTTLLWSSEFPVRGVEGVVSCSYSVGEVDEDSWMTERRDSYS